jgi:hypothetical protein
MIAGGIAGRGRPSGTIDDEFSSQEQAQFALQDAGLPTDLLENFDAAALQQAGYAAGGYQIILGKDGRAFRPTDPGIVEGGALLTSSDGTVGTIFTGDPANAGTRYQIDWIGADGRAPISLISVAGTGERYLMQTGVRVGDLGITASIGRFELSGVQLAQANTGREAVRAAQRAELYAGYQAQVAVSRAIGAEFTNQAVMATGQYMLENATPYGTYLALRQGNYVDAALALTPLTRQLSRALPNNLGRAAPTLNLRGGGRVEPGMYEASPGDIGFAQPTVSSRFGDGRSVDGLMDDLRSGAVSPSDIDPIRVIIRDGRAFSLDNRRLLAFSGAGVDRIPVRVVSESDPAIARLLQQPQRFNPIGGEGRYVVVAPAAQQSAAQTVLRQHGLIR